MVRKEAAGVAETEPGIVQDCTSTTSGADECRIVRKTEQYRNQAG